MNSKRKELWASPLWCAGISLMLSMSAVMLAESFGSSRPPPGAVKAVVVTCEIVGVAMALFAFFRLQRVGRLQP